ncbi:MAG: lecithin retinol acyltransferase family protein [Rubrivivax sp.]|nr:lecithin retinol acyltransferase family protein [Rubrivivax sp.]
MQPLHPPHADWPPGTHLVSPRRGYQHHGLYAGEGRVIHYAGFGRAFRRGPVEEVSLARFTRGRGVHVQPHATPAFAGESAVARARTRLGEDRYRFWSNNCEHLVQWALNGTPRSTQVERWVSGWRRLLGRFAMAAVPAAR